MAGPSVTTISGGPSFGFVNGNTLNNATFHTPVGVALDSSGNFLFVADKDNNAIRELNLSANTTFTLTTTGLNKPVGVALDRGGNLYVVNRASGTGGTVVQIDAFGHLLQTLATGLANAQGVAVDNATNVYVTTGNSVIRITLAGAINTITTVSTSGSALSGITVLSDGSLAVADSGAHGVWKVNPATGSAVQLTGFHGPGDVFGSSAFAKFNAPNGIAAAGGNMLVVADYGNNRVKVVDPLGVVTNLYGVNSNFWVTGSGTYPGWWDGEVARGDANYNAVGYAEARLPAGVFVAGDGSVYSTEDHYHLIRHVTGTGFTGPTGGGGGGGGGTNFVSAPLINPSCGYFPMGQVITVNSATPDVFYTTDGSEPTTNSTRVVMDSNVGQIYWFGSTNDLSSLRVKAFVGATSSATVRGESCTSNTIGVPPGATGSIYAGIGSTIVVPVVVNLRSNVQVKSYQFRVEVTPNNTANAVIDFHTETVSSNDFITLTTAAQNNTTLSVSESPYTIGTTRGLVITTTGSGSFGFQKFAVAALLKLTIPTGAHELDTYSITVSYPSATSDGGSTSVPLTTMDLATIEVRNIPYLVGDSASPFGTWYNAGTFGDAHLDNSDVNNAFYASTGLRVPYSYTDVFNAMDAAPSDAPDFLGGDGQIGFRDWNLILFRSLHLPPPGSTDPSVTNFWWRQWSVGGERISFIDNSISFAQGGGQGMQPFSLGTWSRQALLGAISVNNLGAGATASIPIYIKMADRATLSGLQFRALLTPQNGSPAVTQAPSFVAAPGMPSPTMQQSFQANSKAFGWALGSMNFAARSSNFLGWITFSVPSLALRGHGYTLSFANVDGGPDVNTPYNFESRSANTAVGELAVPATICSDEWKLYYFGSLTDPAAADLADTDGDGVSNWMEFIAGTDPTDSDSYLRFSSAEKRVVSGQPQIVLHWSGVSGKAYEVQSSPTLVGATWGSLGTVSGNGTGTSYTNSNATAASRYYRLRALP